MTKSALQIPQIDKTSALCQANEPELVSGLTGLVWKSSAMRKVLNDVERLRYSNAAVLITGESGTGKEVIARMLHSFGPRNTRQFITLNCATRDLADSQLFGHRKGAFTGATEDSEGVIQAAKNGSLLLDEIGELPMELQPKLLRFLQEKDNTGGVEPAATRRRSSHRRH